jgi:HEAT repeat protein
VAKPICEMLSGGHPNSLGRTEDVVKLVLKAPERMDELFQGYDDPDEVVRLRVSSSLKRVFLAKPDWFKDWFSKFSKRVLRLAQPSALWTYSLLCLQLENQLTPKKKEQAIEDLKHILKTCDDWIVINNTVETLAHWAKGNLELRKWLKPRLKKYSTDRRKSVAKKSAKALEKLTS